MNLRVYYSGAASAGWRGDSSQPAEIPKSVATENISIFPLEVSGVRKIFLNIKALLLQLGNDYNIMGENVKLQLYIEEKSERKVLQ